MKRVTGLYYSAMVVATAALALGYGVAELLWGVPAVLLITGIWFLGDRRGKSWVGSLGLSALAMLAAVGSLLNVASIWTIVALSAGLVAWDIGRFNRLLGSVKWVNEAGSLEKRYRNRLALIAVLGVVVAISATIIRVSFSFGIALLLGLISVIGFSRAISYLRQESA